MSDYDARMAWREHLSDVPLSPATRLLATTLSSLVSASGVGTVSVGELVWRTRLARATVMRALRRLRGLKWLDQLERGGFTPAGVRLSVWRLRAPEEVPWAVDNPDLKVSSGDVEEDDSQTSRSHPETLSRGSRSHPETFRGLKVSSGAPSRSHREPLPLGTRDEDKDKDSSSSLGGDLTRDSDASRGSQAALVPELVREVVEALPSRLRPTSTEELRKRTLFMQQRLNAGWAPERLMEANLAADARMQTTLDQGGVIDSVIGWWLTLVPIRPPRPLRSSIPWCEDPACDPILRMREDHDGKLRKCQVCHPDFAAQSHEHAVA